MSDPNNLATINQKISRSSLLKLLPVGTSLTLIRMARGSTRQTRVVVKATTRQLELRMIGGERDQQISYYYFDPGDEIRLHSQGFSLLREGQVTVSYLFGVWSKDDQLPANTGPESATLVKCQTGHAFHPMDRRAWQDGAWRCPACRAPRA